MAKATGPTYIVKFRRRRNQETNYSRRLALLKSGTRMVVRPSLSSVVVQFLDFNPKGDVVLAGANSSELAEFGWPSRGNAPTAYLTGFLSAKKALKKGVKAAVLDSGLATPKKGGVYYSALKGAIDAGVTIPAGEEIFDSGRIRGEHIAAYAKSLKGSPSFEKQFGAYVKAGVNPEEIPLLFDKVKGKIASR